MSAAMVMPVAHHDAPRKALVAACARRDWRTTATVAMPKEVPACWLMRGVHRGVRDASWRDAAALSAGRLPRRLVPMSARWPLAYPSV